MVLGHELYVLVEREPYIEPGLRGVVGVHGYVINLIIHLISIALVTIPQVNFQVLHKYPSVRGRDNDLKLSVIGVFHTVANESVDHLVARAKTAINVVTMEVANVDRFVENNEFLV